VVFCSFIGVDCHGGRFLEKDVHDDRIFRVGFIPHLLYMVCSLILTNHYSVIKLELESKNKYEQLFDEFYKRDLDF
jgi:hypothetical protein